MLFFITGAGTMTRADNERIFQGSSNVTKMQVVSPFSGVGVSMAFTRPNMTQTHFFPMHADGRFEVPNPDGTKTKTALFCYSLPLDASVTQEVGTVGVSVKINSFVDANGETPVSTVNTLTTYTATFEVEYSALPEVGEPPEADEWAQIVNLLNTYYGELSGRMETAEDDIDGLGTRITAAEGDIDTLQADMKTAQADIVENAQDIAANHTLIVANSEAIEDIDTEQAEQNQRIAAVEAKTAQPLMTNVIIDEGTMTRYFNNGTTTSSTVTTGGETEQRVNFCTTYSFTEANFVEDAGSGLFSLTVSAELIERTNDRYLVSLEYADGTAYATAADSVTKNADGSLLIKNIAQPFAGRVVTIAAGQHGTITHFGTAITGQGVQVSTDTTLRAETSKGDSYLNTATGEYYECIEVSAASTSWQFLASLIGPRGEKGETGDGFEIYKTYRSVAAMNADAANVPDGKFVIIETGNTNDPDNSKLYVRTVDGTAPFEFVTDMSGASIKGDKGEPGATYTPSVDTNGVLTWTNNGNLPNPSPVNLKGPSGTVTVIGTETLPAGSDASVVNSGTATDAKLTFKIPKGDTGAVFTPSVSADGVISWTNNGGLSNPAAQNIKGIQGEPGANGATFIPHITDGDTLSWTNDGGLENPDPVYIRGIQGRPGNDGAAATIVVAETNTTPPGNDAVVSNIGTATNARLVFNIPRGEPGTDGLSLNPKGPFVLNTAYVVGDVATYDNLAYLCYADTAGTTTPDADTAHWQVLSTAATTVGELAANSALYGEWWSNLTTNGTKGKIPNFFAIDENDWTGTTFDDPSMLDDFKPGEWVTVDETSIPGIAEGDIVSFVVRCYGSIEDSMNQTNPTRSLMVLAVYNPYNTPGPGSGNSRILSAAWVPEDTDKNGVATCDLGEVTLQDIDYGSVKMGLADIYFDGTKSSMSYLVAENPARIRLRLAGVGTVYEFDRVSLEINTTNNTRRAQFERATITDDNFGAAEQWFVTVDYNPSMESAKRYHFMVVRMSFPVMRGAEKLDVWQGVDIAYDLGTVTLTGNTATIQIPESDINGLALANVLRLRLQVGSAQTEIGLVRCSVAGSVEYAAVVPSEAVSTESGSASVVVARLATDHAPAQLAVTVYPLSSGGGSGTGGGLTAQTYTISGTTTTIKQFADMVFADGGNVVSIVSETAGSNVITVTTDETTPRNLMVMSPTLSMCANGDLIITGMAMEGDNPADGNFSALRQVTLNAYDGGGGSSAMCMMAGEDTTQSYLGTCTAYISGTYTVYRNKA